MQQLRERRSFGQREERVDVIRHHDPRVLRAEFAFVKTERATDDDRELRPAQQARAVTFIEPPDVVTASAIVA